MERFAEISKCGLYRYSLRRVWDASSAPVVFVGLNPSTADAFQDDNTIRRCVGFAKSWGFGSLVMLNLFAFRATQPRDLFKAEDPVGPMNDFHLGFWSAKVQKHGGRLVAAWGNHGSFRGQDEWFRGKMKEVGVPLFHLGLSAAGKPKHPLYLKADTQPVPWEFQ